MEPLTHNETKMEPQHVNKGNLYEFVPKDIYKPVYYYCFVTQYGLCATSLMNCDPSSNVTLSDLFFFCSSLLSRKYLCPYFYRDLTTDGCFSEQLKTNKGDV